MGLYIKNSPLRVREPLLLADGSNWTNRRRLHRRVRDNGMPVRWTEIRGHINLVTNKIDDAKNSTGI
jgi:hypothetical protein